MYANYLPAPKTLNKQEKVKTGLYFKRANNDETNKTMFHFDEPCLVFDTRQRHLGVNKQKNALLFIQQLVFGLDQKHTTRLQINSYYKASDLSIPNFLW